MIKFPARVRPQNGYSLYMVLLSCFFFIIAALLAFTAGLLMPRIAQLLERNAVDRTKETVQQSTNSLELYVDNMLSTLHFTSGLLAETASSGAADFEKIQLLRASQPDVVNIAFFTEDGRVLYATAGSVSASGDAVRHMEWFQKALEWEGTVPYFSIPYVQHIFTDQYRWVISLSRAVEYAEDGQSKTGVVLMDYNYPAIAALTSDVALGSSGYVYILDTHEQLICHPHLQLIYAGIKTEDLSAVQAQVVGVCRDIDNGRERVLAINTVGQTRWRMVGVAYIDEILILQSAFIRMFTIALICGGLLSLSAASLTTYYVMRPIDHLQKKMRQVEEGDLYTSISMQGFKEIRLLSETFNHMLERIRLLMQQIVSEQEAKRLHELNALQAQINPHFLYNTLDSIIWMEERGRSREAIMMVSALAKLFRISISKGRNIITMREELEHARNYLIIQKMRFRNKFTYEIEADEAVLRLFTVKLIIQPLVENSVHHGIHTFEDRILHISIHAKLEGDLLIISVKDDGIGIPKEKLADILIMPMGTSGIGLRNVHERLQLTCGPEYGLTVESHEDVGTSITIRLPANLEGQ